MRLGAYEVQQEIGRGGAGVVYRARGADGRAVAIKVLLETPSAEKRARFEREERLLATLGAADGFVPLLERGETPRGPFFVMPYLAGGTLRERLRRGALELDEALRVVTRIARALGVAHAKGIVHRDVKPENVLYDEREQPYLADLGLAKHFAKGAAGGSQSVSISAAGDYRGSVGYSAPEQLTGSKDAGPPADVFALGAVLFEVLTGAPAFPGDSVMDVVTKIARGGVDDPRRIRPDVPRWVARIVARALHADAEKRYPDGAAFAAALEAGPGAERRGALLAGAAAALLLVVGVAVVALRPEAPKRANGSLPSPAPAPTPTPTPTPSIPLEDEQSPDTWLRRAEKAAAKGDHVAALGHAERALKLDGRLPRAWAQRGHARHALKDYEGAVSDFERAIELDPTRERDHVRPYVKALERRGMAKVSTSDIPGALADYDLAIAKDPTYAPAYKSRSELLVQMRKHGAALADAEKAVELDPDSSRNWYMRGMVRFTMNDLTGAISDYDKAVALDPAFAGAWSDLSSARGMNGDMDGALAAGEKAVALEPKKLPGAWSNLARVKYFRKDYQGALADATRAIELQSGNADAYLTRAETRVELKDFRGAVEDANNLVSLRPMQGFSWYVRGCTRANAGDKEGAESDLARARELDPTLQPRIAEVLRRLKQVR